MDKIKKFLAKLTVKERDVVANLIVKAISGELGGLDVKKLKGFERLYRIRKGKIRVIFEKGVSCNKVINVDYRGKVYERF